MSKFLHSSFARFLAYFAYFIFIYLLIIQGIKFGRTLYDIHQRTYELMPSLIYGLSFYIFIGFLLGIPHFVRIARKPGVWKFNWVIFLAAGVPSFYILITPLIIETGIAEYWPLIFLIFRYGKTLYSIAGIVIGYMLITSFNKQDSEHYSA